MALKQTYRFKFKNVIWKSGYIYTFRYNSYRSDPTPTIILLQRTTGRHPNTGNQHNYITGINFTYIPRSHRRLFGLQWKNAMERTRGNVQFTWNDVKRQFPYLRFGIRRYLLNPNYRIQKPIEIPLDDMEDAIIDTWSKDYSKKVKVDMVQKFNRIKKFQKAHNKKTKKSLRSMFGGFFSRR